MSTGYNKCDTRIRDLLNQAVRVDVPCNMMGPNQGLVQSKGQTLRGHNSDKQRAYQARPLRHRNRGQLVRRDAGLLNSLLKHQSNTLDMFA
ncbi:hypothetical protein D3C80_1998590 [compost metagenome]